MRKSAAILFIFFLLAGASRSQAQSLKHSAWKFYVESLHDTLTMHIGEDSSFSTSSSGEMIVRSFFKVTNDTVKIKDIDGEYPCLQGEGVYRYVISGDVLSFYFINDPCPNRSEALRDVKFIKTKTRD